MDRKDRLFQLFSKNVRGVLERAAADPDRIEEIRMRIGAPLFLIYKGAEYAVSRNGALVSRRGWEDGEVMRRRRFSARSVHRCTPMRRSSGRGS